MGHHSPPRHSHTLGDQQPEFSAELCCRRWGPARTPHTGPPLVWGVGGESPELPGDRGPGPVPSQALTVTRQVSMSPLPRAGNQRIASRWVAVSGSDLGLQGQGQNTFSYEKCYMYGKLERVSQ